MNKTILFLAALTLALLLAVVGLTVLAAAAPFPPDAPLYPLQSQAEQWRLQLTRDQETRTQFAFDLVRRRLQNLRQADDSAAVSTSCQAVELSLARAVVLNPKVEKLYRRELERLNEERLGAVEKIRAFMLLPEPWTAEAGQLTPTLKLRREVMTRQFEAEIGQMFDLSKHQIREADDDTAQSP